MRAFSKREVWVGVGAGLVAGVVFAIWQIAVAISAGASPVLPFRMFASLWFGELALDPTRSDAGRYYDVVIIGSIVHLSIAALAGIGFAALDSAVSRRASLTARAALGAAYGVAMWLVNFQLLARVVYPWFLAESQLAQVALHALAFGVPLGLMYAALEERAESRLAHDLSVVAA